MVCLKNFTCHTKYLKYFIENILHVNFLIFEKNLLQNKLKEGKKSSFYMNAKLHIWHWVKNHIIMSQYSIQGPNGILRKKLRFLNNSCEKTNFIFGIG